MKKVSEKQAIKNRLIAQSKKRLIDEYGCRCQICGSRFLIQLAHLLPKSRYPEYYLEPENHALFCQDCHFLYDNDIDFRQHQEWAYRKIKIFDELAANKYFKR